MQELIVLVNNSGKPIGTAPKLASHHANTPLHLAFSCYIFNSSGQLLVTKRSNDKKVWPSVWTNSVCGHPAPNESIEDAITRRSAYELGITKLSKLTPILPGYRYKTPPYKGIVENEICPVYVAMCDQQPKPNPKEVGDWHWQDLTQVKKAVKASPDVYSYWFKDQLPELETKPLFKDFAKQAKLQNASA